MSELYHDRLDSTAHRPLYETSYSSETEDGIAFSVIDAVAEAAGVSAFDIDEQLYSVIDPDALEAVFHEDAIGHNGYVVFEFAGYEVVTHSSGVISVYET